MIPLEQNIGLRWSFILRKTYQNEEGKNPIIFRVHYQSQQRDTFTDLYVFSMYWLRGENRIDSNEPNAAYINKQMELIAQKAKEHFDELRFSKIEFTIDDLAGKIRGKDPLPETLIDYVDQTIKNFKKRLGVDLSKPTFYCMTSK